MTLFENKVPLTDTEIEKILGVPPKEASENRSFVDLLLNMLGIPRGVMFGISNTGSERSDASQSLDTFDEKVKSLP